MTPHPSSCRQSLLVLAAGVCFTIATAAAQAAEAVTPAATAKAPAKTAPKTPAKAADGKPAEGSLGSGAGSGTLMTRDELRQCLDEQDRMKQETAAIVSTQAALAKDRAEIDRVSSAIDADRASVNRSDQAAVDAFNERWKARTKLIEAYQAAAPEFNRRVDKLDADQQAYAKNCKDRRYDEKDFNALKAAK
jgi:hypothetical protein